MAQESTSLEDGKAQGPNYDDDDLDDAMASRPLVGDGAGDSSSARWWRSHSR